MLDTVVRAGIRLAPPQVGFAVTRRLAAHPRRSPVSAHEASALASARRGCYGAGGRIPTWTWGHGPVIALVHGWGGRAAQMAPLAVQLAQAGFSAVAFDVAGHGDSPVNEARWEWFLRDVAEVAASAGPLRAFVGHSAGGLALMASRNVYGLRAERYVCISAPHHPYPPLRAIQRRLNPTPAVLELYRRFLSEQFQCDWGSLEAGLPWRGAGADLLLCYDEDDRYVDPLDGRRIRTLCPHSTMITTRGFGHTKILAADATAVAVLDFVRVAN